MFSGNDDSNQNASCLYPNKLDLKLSLFRWPKNSVAGTDPTPRKTQIRLRPALGKELKKK